MNKDTIKRIIIENQEFLNNVEVIERNYTLEPNANYVIVGPRRVGKTYFLYKHIKETVAFDCDKILYINFEDERLLELKADKLDLLLECYKELFDQKPILFFDEIQNVDGWEKFARRLADKAYRIYITGSNAKMLSKEIATVLGGRFLIKEIHPLSFSEYLTFHNVKLEKNYEYTSQLIEVKKHFVQYLKFGGFPELIKFQHPKEYLNSLYKKVFYGDILMRYSIDNDFVLRLLVKKIAESVTNETSFNRIKNIIKSTGVQVGTATLIDYFGYLNDSFLIYSNTNYLYKLSERTSRRKFYFADNGVLNLFLTDQPQKLLENLVFVQLRRIYGETAVYYVQKDVETDFYVAEHQLLIQVCWNISEYETRKREIGSLVKMANRFGISSGMIITNDEADSVKEKNIDIEIVPIWKWLA